MKEQKKLEIANVQYAKHQLDDGRQQLNINGHINNQYYETTVIVSDNVISNKQDFENLLHTSLISARQKTKELGEK